MNRKPVDIAILNPQMPLTVPVETIQMPIGNRPEMHRPTEFYKIFAQAFH
jgi:hypothetical protein